MVQLSHGLELNNLEMIPKMCRLNCTFRMFRSYSKRFYTLQCLHLVKEATLISFFSLSSCNPVEILYCIVQHIGKFHFFVSKNSMIWKKYMYQYHLLEQYYFCQSKNIFVRTFLVFKSYAAKFLFSQSKNWISKIIFDSQNQFGQILIALIMS